jgi:hypothetical protein
VERIEAEVALSLEKLNAFEQLISSNHELMCEDPSGSGWSTQ